MRHLLYIFVLLLIVKTGTSLKCETCRGIPCYKSRIAQLTCGRIYPQLPFEFDLTPLKNNGRYTYGCFDLEYYKGTIPYRIKQCLPVTEGKCICERLGSILNIKQCSFLNRRIRSQDNDERFCDIREQYNQSNVTNIFSSEPAFASITTKKPDVSTTRSTGSSSSFKPTRLKCSTSAYTSTNAKTQSTSQKTQLQTSPDTHYSEHNSVTSNYNTTVIDLTSKNAGGSSATTDFISASSNPESGNSVVMSPDHLVDIVLSLNSSTVNVAETANFSANIENNFNSIPKTTLKEIVGLSGDGKSESTLVGALDTVTSSLPSETQKAPTIIKSENTLNQTSALIATATTDNLENIPQSSPIDEITSNSISKTTVQETVYSAGKSNIMHLSTSNLIPESSQKIEGSTLISPTSIANSQSETTSQKLLDASNDKTTKQTTLSLMNKPEAFSSNTAGAMTISSIKSAKATSIFETTDSAVPSGIVATKDTSKYNSVEEIPEIALQQTSHLADGSTIVPSSASISESSSQSGGSTLKNSIIISETTSQNLMESTTINSMNTSEPLFQQTSNSFETITISNMKSTETESKNMTALISETSNSTAALSTVSIENTSNFSSIKDIPSNSMPEEAVKVVDGPTTIASGASVSETSSQESFTTNESSSLITTASKSKSESKPIYNSTIRPKDISEAESETITISFTEGDSTVGSITETAKDTSNFSSLENITSNSFQKTANPSDVSALVSETNPSELPKTNEDSILIIPISTSNEQAETTLQKLLDTSNHLIIESTTISSKNTSELPYQQTSNSVEALVNSSQKSIEIDSASISEATNSNVTFTKDFTENTFNFSSTEEVAFNSMPETTLQEAINLVDRSTAIIPGALISETTLQTMDDIRSETTMKTTTVVDMDTPETVAQEKYNSVGTITNSNKISTEIDSENSPASVLETSDSTVAVTTDFPEDTSNYGSIKEISVADISTKITSITETSVSNLTSDKILQQLTNQGSDAIMKSTTIGLMDTPEALSHQTANSAETITNSNKNYAEIDSGNTSTSISADSTARSFLNDLNDGPTTIHPGASVSETVEESTETNGDSSTISIVSISNSQSESTLPELININNDTIMELTTRSLMSTPEALSKYTSNSVETVTNSSKNSTEIDSENMDTSILEMLDVTASLITDSTEDFISVLDDKSTTILIGASISEASSQKSPKTSESSSLISTESISNFQSETTLQKMKDTGSNNIMESTTIVFRDTPEALSQQTSNYVGTVTNASKNSTEIEFGNTSTSTAEEYEAIAALINNSADDTANFTSVEKIASNSVPETNSQEVVTLDGGSITIPDGTSISENSSTESTDTSEGSNLISTGSISDFQSETTLQKMNDTGSNTIMESTPIVLRDTPEAHFQQTSNFVETVTDSSKNPIELEFGNKSTSTEEYEANAAPVKDSTDDTVEEIVYNSVPETTIQEIGLGHTSTLILGTTDSTTTSVTNATEDIFNSSAVEQIISQSVSKTAFQETVNPFGGSNTMALSTSSSISETNQQESTFTLISHTSISVMNSVEAQSEQTPNSMSTVKSTILNPLNISNSLTDSVVMEVSNSTAALPTETSIWLHEIDTQKPGYEIDYQLANDTTVGSVNTYNISKESANMSSVQTTDLTAKRTSTVRITSITSSSQESFSTSSGSTSNIKTTYKSQVVLEEALISKETSTSDELMIVHSTSSSTVLELTTRISTTIKSGGAEVPNSSAKNKIEEDYEYDQLNAAYRPKPIIFILLPSITFCLLYVLS